MRAAQGLLPLLLLTGCSSAIGFPSLGWYPFALDKNKLHKEVFDESFKRVHAYALEPVSFRYAVSDGLGALRKLDPALPLQLPSQPENDNWQGWSALTYQTIKASPVLGQLPPEEVYQPFFAAFLADLDGFSHYLSPEDADTMEEWNSGYGGIGVTFERKGTQFLIMDVFVGSPAAQAGLRAGDEVLTIEGQPVTQLSAKEFAERVRGPIGQPLRLGVQSRESEAREVVVARARVIPSTVQRTMNGELAIIRISRFMQGTVGEFRKAARQAAWSGAKAVALDLQHNPGGILESATEIGALLVPRGPVAKMVGRHANGNNNFNGGGADILNGLPLYVLIDSQTASAAETLTAALQDRGRAVVLGSTSFGKGSVQNVGVLPHGGELAVTWARLYAPSGYSYMRQGVQPDVCLSRAEQPENNRAGLLALQIRANQDDSAIKELLEKCPRATDLEAKTLAKVQEMAAKQAIK
jgi:carboxyl-terminal processing protease